MHEFAIVHIHGFNKLEIRIAESIVKDKIYEVIGDFG